MAFQPLLFVPTENTAPEHADGWRERSTATDFQLMVIGLARDKALALKADDRVLYRNDRCQLVPAVLVEAAGGGCWLARDARHTRGLIYLDPERIATRLPRMDLLEEAA